ncbi:MAG: transketolase C-terminal domain-containing protein, partial [Candidatus Margulisbacteria bacterium]|nr:transketolase C-terminal domain-containing protein [Candidatus Margulisiibacteriota bacterium]
ITPIYEVIKENKFNINLVNVRFIKPFDEVALKYFLKQSKVIITAEEGVVEGGLYGLVSEIIQREGLNVKTASIGLNNNVFVEHGSKDDLFKKFGMDKEAIKRVLIKSLEVDEC